MKLFRDQYSVPSNLINDNKLIEILEKNNYDFEKAKNEIFD